MNQIWGKKRLKDVATFSRGLTYKKIEEVEFSKNVVLRANNINVDTNQLDFSDLKFINDKIIIPLEKKVSKGSLIICIASGSKSHLGKVALVESEYDYAIGGFMGKITPNECINSKYLFYILTSPGYRQFIDSISDGVNINNLRFDQLEQFEFSLPSLPEQRRIVAKLDEAFVAIDRAVENTRKNVQNARELYQSYLRKILVQKSSDWNKIRLGDICIIERGGSPRPISSYITTDPDGINWIKIGDTKGASKYIYHTKEKIKPEGVKKSRMVYEGEFLLSNSMSFGRPYILKTSGCIHDGWLVLREITSDVDKNYLYHVLGSDVIFEQFDYFAAGSTVRNLNIDLVKKVTIPLPSLKEQKKIGFKLDKLTEQLDQLDIKYKKKLLTLLELKQSILTKAFSGEL